MASVYFQGGLGYQLGEPGAGGLVNSRKALHRVSVVTLCRSAIIGKALAQRRDEFRVGVAGVDDVGGIGLLAG